MPRMFACRSGCTNAHPMTAALLPQYLIWAGNPLCTTPHRFVGHRKQHTCNIAAWKRLSTVRTNCCPTPMTSAASCLLISGFPSVALLYQHLRSPRPLKLLSLLVLLLTYPSVKPTFVNTFNMSDAQQAADTINPMGGQLPTEDAVDIKPGQGEVQDLPGTKESLKNLKGDIGTVKGAGLGTVQGGIDARGGTDAPSVAEQTDTSKLEGSKA